MPTPNQIHIKREDVHITQQDLLTVPKGTITEEGIRTNIDVGVIYMASWLDGLGCVPIYHLMEDAATAEISRSQLWQWVHNENARLNDGRPIDAELYRQMVPDVLAHIKEVVGEEQYNNGKYDQAAELFEDLVTEEEFTDFLTWVAYEEID
jgi:malate synthase